jgi:GT2 family glycosyltransferase
VESNPLVSIIIPSRGLLRERGGTTASDLLHAVRSVIERSTFLNYEFVIVLDVGASLEVIQGLKQLEDHTRLRIVWFDKPFNFSEKINLGACHARGDYFMILNDDIEIITMTWLTDMVSALNEPQIALVGALLYFEDGSVQHAGHSYQNGAPDHVLSIENIRVTETAVNGERDVSGVTAACALVRRSVFFDVGGFTVLLPGNFNDVDFCLKIRKLGHRIVIQPSAKLFHFESVSRNTFVHDFELTFLEKRWGLQLRGPDRFLASTR